MDDLVAQPKKKRTRRNARLSHECSRCGGALARSVVNFGEALPKRDLEASSVWAERAELFIVVGSSCTVEPASNLPKVARQNGSRVAILNVGETGIEGHCDLRVADAPVGTVLPALWDCFAA